MATREVQTRIVEVGKWSGKVEDGMLTDFKFDGESAFESQLFVALGVKGPKMLRDNLRAAMVDLVNLVVFIGEIIHASADTEIKAEAKKGGG